MFLFQKVYNFNTAVVRGIDKYTIPGGVNFELLFNAATIIKPSDELIDVIPLKTVTICELMEKGVDREFVSFYAIVFSIGEIKQVTSKGKQLPIRRIVLLDDSGSDVVTCTLWNEQSSGYDFKENDAVFVKNNKVNIYKGVKAVTCFNDGSVTKQDDMRAKELSTWCIQNMADSAEETDDEQRDEIDAKEALELANEKKE